MELLKQCEFWNENHEFEKIIEAVEAINFDERSIELQMLLARAYLHVNQDEGKEGARNALFILRSIEDDMQDNPRWNYRIGYAYYQLDQELKALPYFQIAFEAYPDDEDLAEIIDYCQDMIRYSNFEQTFKERTTLAWQTFEEKEADLRELMKSDKNHQRGDELMEIVGDILNIAITDPAFEMGFNDDKYELIISPEGVKLHLFAINYFVKRAPKSVLKNWDILVGKQANPNFATRLNEDGLEISAGDVEILVDKQGENVMGLRLYCEKLLPLLKSDESKVWWLLSMLVDHEIGELSAMKYIASFDIFDKPLGKETILLKDLPEALSKFSMNIVTDPSEILESYFVYKGNPLESDDENFDYRRDIITGSTNCPSLIKDYMNNDNGDMEILYADGIAAGFLFYPLDELREENSTNLIFEFRDELEDYLQQNCGEENIYITGSATGTIYGYVDFIAWDLKTVLKTAQAFFKNKNIEFTAFHSFVREVEPIILYKRESE